MVLLSYLLDNQRQYCYYDVKTGQIKNGTVNATSEGFPFFPRWQHGNELIGYLESESGEKNGSLLFYTLKWYFLLSFSKDYNHNSKQYENHISNVAEDFIYIRSDAYFVFMYDYKNRR